MFGVASFVKSFRIDSISKEEPSDQVPLHLMGENWRYGLSVGVAMEKIAPWVAPSGTTPEVRIYPFRMGGSAAWTDSHRWDASIGFSTYYVSSPSIKSNQGEFWLGYALKGEFSPPYDKAKLLPMRYRGGEVVDDASYFTDDLFPPARHLMTGPDLLTPFESPEAAWMPINWTSKISALRYGIAGAGRLVTLATIPDGTYREKVQQFGHRLEFISSDPLRRVFVLGATAYFYNVDLAATEAALTTRTVFDSSLGVYRDVLASLPRGTLDASWTIRSARGAAFLIQARGWQTRMDSRSGFGFLMEYRFPTGKRFWLGIHALGSFGSEDLKNMGGGASLSFTR